MTAARSYAEAPAVDMPKLISSGRMASATQVVLPPEQLGVSLEGAEVGTTLLSFWLVEASAGSGEKRVSVQPIAVKSDGTRVPSVERQASQVFHAAETIPILSPEERLSLFASAVEPTLQRELRHKGAGNRDGSFSAELIGYVEIT